MKRTSQAVLVLTVVLVGSAPAAPAVATDHVTVESVAYGGQSVGTTTDEPLFVWQSDSHEFSVGVTARSSVEDAAVCLLANSSTGPRELACRNVSLEPGDERTIQVEVVDWPANLTGPRSVGAIVRNRTAETRLDKSIVTLVLLRREGDLDGDGLSNEAEVEAGTDLRAADTDGDGLDDTVEVRGYGTDPTDLDTDGDGLDDETEVEIHNTDPTDADTDDDGLSDGREVELGTAPTSPDTDGDTLDDGTEVNRYQTDPLAADTDGDGLRDDAEVREYETDPLGDDTDDDGLNDGTEVHLHGTDPTRADSDSDGLSDEVEVTQYFTDPTDPDTDGDGLNDGAEVREYETEPLSADTDRDGLSDGREVQLGSDPTDPTSTADPGPLRRVLWAASDRPLLVGLGGVGLVVLLGIVVTVRRSDRTFPEQLGRLRASEPVSELDETTSPADISGADPVASTDESASDPVATDEDRERSSVDDGAPGEEDDGPAPPADTRIMTNEERVAHLLDAHGGRMLQSEMVEADDWSKATVSRVLSRMEEEGSVTRVDIGRGNLVTRPEDEPPNVDSPFED